MWPAVEPGRKMIEGWVMDAICEHLEAVADKHIKRLIINVPPGSSKSLLSNVFFPAWLWGPRNEPSTRIMAASYSQSLTVRDNVRFRQVVQSDEYASLWGDRFRISSVDASKIKFANDKTGWKLATSVGGTTTGERADIVICDDPNNVADVESEAVRGNTNRWLLEVMPTRLNHLDESSIICIQQRTHEADATGTLTNVWEDYDWLLIPMHYDAERHCATSIGWNDPRTEDGQLCWPARFSEKAVRELQATLGPYASSGQLEQAPTVRGGAILRRDWWQPWTGAKFPPMSYIVAALDGAFTEKDENDPSAMVTLGVFTHPVSGRSAVMLMHAWAERLELHALVKRVSEGCTKRRVDMLLIENKGSGIPVQQEYRRLYRGAQHGVLMVDPAGKDKVSRAHSVVPIMADGGVFAPADADGLPATKWCDDMITEAAMFPRGAHDDRVDAFVMCMRYLRDNGMLERNVETKSRELDENMYSRDYSAPYEV